MPGVRKVVVARQEREGINPSESEGRALPAPPGKEKTMKTISEVKKHRLALTDMELEILESRLERVNPNDYSLGYYAILRNLYGRIVHIRLRSQRNYK